MIDLNAYAYHLPKERIAQKPARRRDHSKLLILEQNQIKHRTFHQIIDEIQKGDLLVGNDSKVVASSLEGKKDTGGKVEILFLREIDSSENEWECLLKGRKLRIGSKVFFLNGKLIGTILKWKKLGQFIVKFTSKNSIQDLLDEHASITLPPISKPPRTTYQDIKHRRLRTTIPFY